MANVKELEAKTTYDGGLMGGGVTSFMDFSITRNVFTMLLTVLILFFVVSQCGQLQPRVAKAKRQKACKISLSRFTPLFATK